MSTSYKKMTTLIFISMMILTIVSISGCKEKSEPEQVAETIEEAAVEVIEQTKCPVMNGTINKELFTEYNGKKVYFCCPGCKEQFLKEPEKYLSKLPQFND